MRMRRPGSVLIHLLKTMAATTITLPASVTWMPGKSIIAPPMKKEDAERHVEGAVLPSEQTVGHGDGTQESRDGREGDIRGAPPGAEGRMEHHEVGKAEGRGPQFTGIPSRFQPVSLGDAGGNHRRFTGRRGDGAQDAPVDKEKVRRHHVDSQFHQRR